MCNLCAVDVNAPSWFTIIQMRFAPPRPSRLSLSKGLLPLIKNMPRLSAEKPSLTELEKLRISRIILPRGIKPGSLGRLAENAIERQASGLLNHFWPRLMTGCRDPVKVLFFFRAIYVPIMCQAQIAMVDKALTAIPLFLGEHSTYVHALERICVERRVLGGLFGKKRKFDATARGSGAGTESAGWISATAYWFNNPKEGHLYWLARFNSFREAARKSLDYYLRKQCGRDAKFMNSPSSREAARFGLIENLHGLPEEYFAEDLDRIFSDSRKAALFRKVAKKRNANPPNMDINTWLLEIWPVVSHYDWNFVQVRAVAAEKFSQLTECPHLKEVSSVTNIEDRCKKLGLSLSPKGQKRTGRPSNSRWPVMGSFAMRMNGIGSDPEAWIVGDNWSQYEE